MNEEFMESPVIPEVQIILKTVQRVDVREEIPKRPV